jgi:hypothetical protein
MPNSTPDESSGTEKTRAQLADWLGKAPGFIAILGAVSYAAFNMVLRVFYGGLEVTPEEVGWDAGTVVVRFAPTFVLAGVFGFAVLGYSLRIQGRHSPWLPWLAGTLAVVLLYAFLIFSAGVRQDAAQDGRPLGVSIDSMVPISAPCVTVYWLDALVVSGDALPAFDGTKEFLLLGQAHGTAVIYDSDTDVPIRVAANKVLIRGCPGEPS